MKILLVDDDPDLLAVTAFALQQAGFQVVKAMDGRLGLQLFESEQPDLAVLDINMPRMNGFELARALREKSPLPILMLTARSEEEDVVRSLALGADDYLTKPFSPRILIARIRALLRRSGMDAEGTAQLGNITLDATELTLRAAGHAVRLTPLEAKLLQLLFAHEGRTVPTERILTHVWGQRGGGNRQLLKQLVHRLRQKLEGEGFEQLVRTVPNAGYRVTPPDRGEATGPNDP